MTLCHRDLAFYYNKAEFKTFRKDSTLFLVMDVPITSDNLAHNFQLYDVIKLPIAIPEMHGYYSMLATDITTIVSAKDADVFIQMTDNRQPPSDIWHVSDVALTFLDRNKPTCTCGLMEGNLSENKATCRYRVHKSPHPRSVLRVHGNTFLLTNITQLRLHCPGQFDGEEQVLHLHGTQTLHQFDCHCDQIHADEFCIVPYLNFCNESMDLSDVSTVHYPINLAYFSEFFNWELFNLTAETLLNHTVGTDLPDLAVVNKLLDEKTAEEKAAAFDMEIVINSTKTSAKVYDNLTHYLFNEMITAQDNTGDFDFFSPWTWFTILGWLVAIAALVLVIMLRLKVRPLFFLLMAKGS